MNISNNVKSLVAKVFTRTVKKPEPVEEEEKEEVLTSSVVCQMITGNQVFDEQFKHVLRYEQN